MSSPGNKTVRSVKSCVNDVGGALQFWTRAKEVALRRCSKRLAKVIDLQPPRKSNGRTSAAAAPLWLIRMIRLAKSPNKNFWAIPLSSMARATEARIRHVSAESSGHRDVCENVIPVPKDVYDPVHEPVQDSPRSSPRSSLRSSQRSCLRSYLRKYSPKKYFRLFS